MSELKFAANNPKSRNKKYSGNIDKINEEYLSGWVVNNKSPDEQLRLELLINGQVIVGFDVDQLRPDIVQQTGVDQPYGFSLNIAESLDAHLAEYPELVQIISSEKVEVAVRIADTDTFVGPSTYKLDFRNMAQREISTTSKQDALEKNMPNIIKSTDDLGTNLSVSTGVGTDATELPSATNLEKAGTDTDELSGIVDAAGGIEVAAASDLTILLESESAGFQGVLPGTETIDPSIQAQTAMPHGGLSSPLAKDDSVPTPEPPLIEGNVDMVRGGMAYGWVWNKNGPDQHVPVELWVDGTLMGLGSANQERPDLVEVQVGKGDHGFSFELPPECRDGKIHTIVIKESLTGSELSPGALEYELDMTLRSWIDGVHGASLTGWLAREYPSVFGADISVWEGRDIVAQGRADQPMEDPDAARFNIPLPSRLFDSRVHHFIVKDENDDILGECVQALPYILTPEDALLKYGGGHLRGQLIATNAAKRYESLRYQFSLLGQDESIEPALRRRLGQIYDAHEHVLHAVMQTPKGARYLPSLAFPKIDNPDVSIVIPVHNKFEVTYNCLASLILSPNKVSFEVIVVDDGSQDETLNINNLVSGITLLRNESAQGFVRSSNRGGSVARGHYIVMLNNDTEVGARWLDEMLSIFHDQQRVGMVGAKLVYPNGTLQEAGGIVWNTGDPWNYGRGANPYDPRYNYVRDVDYLSGACIMLPKPLWDELGGFDIMFAPAYFEDTDLAFRVRAKGLRTVYTPFCEIIHYEGVSSGTSTSSGMKRYQEINRPKFKKRHVPACYYNGVVGVDVELNKDRNVRYRVLVIDATTPTPDKDAGSYAAIQEMRLLQSFGCKLTFIPENMAYLGRYTEELQRMGVECVYAPFATSPLELLKARGREFDLVYITRYTVAEKYIESIREYAPAARIAFNNADLHFLRELRLAIANHDQNIMSQALRTRDAELAVMRQVDLTLSYNEVEHAVILSHNLDSSQVAKCPWVVDVPENIPEFGHRSDIAFLGGYGHPPNVEAVETFVHEVMPLLRKRLPGVCFRIYGSNPPKSFDVLKADDVIVEGWVEDVAEVYNTCRVFVAPLKTGAGLKGKVVGALAYGVPSVISPVAAEGIGLRDGLEARIVAKSEAWVDAIAELYEDEAKWRACSEAARKFASFEYSFEQARVLMGEALAQVGIFAEQ